jgi:Glycosyltransferase WbsX
MSGSDGMKDVLNCRARLIAYYLPQYHPIPENDEWWGKGFTEWTNVAKAKPLFPGHDQPRLPADLGFYDLRVPEARVAQAELAKRAGIEGFCYWHYWFAGKRLLERPFTEVLQSGEPDFPFCLGWANQTWTGIWHGAPEQSYPGPADHERHFYALLPAFLDKRYIRVNEKPLMLIYDAANLPEGAAFIEQWQHLACKNGLPGIQFVAHLFCRTSAYDPWPLGFDAVTVSGLSLFMTYSKLEIELARLKRASANGSAATSLGGQVKVMRNAFFAKAQSRLRRCSGRPVGVFGYADAAHFLLDELEKFGRPQKTYPCVLTNWDNSPRSGLRALILQNSTPESFRTHLREVLRRAEALPPTNRIVFVKSWNEWAEGNYLEPDRQFGHQRLEVLREEVIAKPPESSPLSQDDASSSFGRSPS